MRRFTYRGAKTREISFPLGGIGTGCIGLGGNGRLIDWEIANRPSKGSFNGFSHFAVKAESEGRLLDARVLHGDLLPPYTGQLGQPDFQSFGFGPPRQTLAGLPHFRAVDFTGAFPIATLAFRDRTFPGRVRLVAYNPFIPLADQDSGIPAAFCEVQVRNTTDEPIAYTIAGTLANPLPAANLHTIAQRPEGYFLHLATNGVSPNDVGFGDLTLATDAPDVSRQQYWYRGAWMDDLEVYWRDLTTPGRLRDRTYPAEVTGAGNHGTLAAHFTVAPGRTARARFLIAWHFPNRVNYWNPEAGRQAEAVGVPLVWRNWYATVWESSLEAAAYGLQHWGRLYRETKAFRDALFASDLPPAALDAVSANLAVLKSPAIMRLEDGTFYGFEGCHQTTGCCEGSCTHVWNYAQALPFLFPALERSMRAADYRHNLRPDGGMPFRLQLPLGTTRSGFRPCADGQFGGVLKAYRDWKISGDTAWLRGLWPAIKASIAFAWHPGNPDRWDPERTGVLWGRQHHTLDMELFGPNSWLTGFYLGALRAGAEMAEHLGEPETAEEYRALLARGQAWADEHLFNGEYYGQIVALGDRSVVEQFAAPEYWSEEHQELKYQIGEGCEVDQVLAQWHANLYGLGALFDPEQTRQALQAVFRHNFVRPMRDLYNPWRIFCLNDEGGLVMCSWPEGRRRPAIPLTYAQETMQGFEYAAAGLMIQSGLVEEGMTVVEAVRERYDGEKRNPWNEIECGSNYARSMASYALLNACSGFEFDLTRGRLGFSPLRTHEGRFRCLWSLDPAWGEFGLAPGLVELRVLGGKLQLAEFNLPFLADQRVLTVSLGAKEIPFAHADGCLRLEATITPRRRLRVAYT